MLSYAKFSGNELNVITNNGLIVKLANVRGKIDYVYVSNLVRMISRPKVQAKPQGVAK
jgi:hypothetical protein